MELPVLGVPTTFVTNFPAVLGIVEETFGHWAAFTLPADQPGSVAPTIRIAVNGGHPASTPIAGFRYRLPDRHRLLVTCDGGVAVADTLRYEAVAYVDESLVTRHLEFAEGMLEPLTLFVLGALDREPLHAAGIVRDGVAILLAGRSGTGKSTLTYAAWRHGFSLLADEPVYVQMRPRLRLWGRRPRVHLRPDALVHFPELRGLPVSTLPSGKSKIVVPIGSRVEPCVERAALCLLSPGRRDRSPTLERITVDEAVAELGRELEPGFDLFAGTIEDRICAIAALGAWRLRVARSPTDALPLLERIAAEL
ncbi:MAG TPA: hypothetical protein VNN07_12760 [Candidatus Tectomicrobia bacterium]|nr:hypothetical protein [Candidatus Tectomicrobia bacterium]